LVRSDRRAAVACGVRRHYTRIAGQIRRGVRMRSESPCSLRSALCVVVATGLAAVFLMVGLAVAQGTQGLVRITTATGTGDRDSHSPRLSAHGEVVAFFSDSDLLGQGIPDGQNEIWLYDTRTMTYTRITTATGAGTRHSSMPSLSGDGRLIAFYSDSDFLGEGISDHQYQIWLYDTTTMTYTRVTTSSHNNRDSYYPRLSANGELVVFYSNSDLLGQGIPDFQDEIWLYDRTTMTYTRVTTSPDASRDSRYPYLNADGTVVAFHSDVDFLGQGIVDEQYEIWLYDRTAMTYTRVTTSADANRDSQYPWLSADGTVVAFQSDADLLGEGVVQGQEEIWLYDTTTMTYTRITGASATNRASRHPCLAADGKLVAFYSDSDFLNQGILDDHYEVWLYDTTTMTYTNVTSASGTNRDSTYPYLSGDGTVIAFQSDSDFLSQGILDDQYEVWLKRVRYRVYLPLVLRAN
jgi:Tol biopolymer transport system component